MFTIEPFIGPLPLKFGMAPEEVASFLGPPNHEFLDPFGNLSESRQNLSLGYDASSSKLVEAVFSRGSHVLFQGKDMFDLADLIGFLRQHDSNPLLAVGVVFFIKLGISVTGFHDNDESQQGITATIPGRWDEFLEDLIPLE